MKIFGVSIVSSSKALASSHNPFIHMRLTGHNPQFLPFEELFQVMKNLYVKILFLGFNDATKIFFGSNNG